MALEACRALNDNFERRRVWNLKRGMSAPRSIQRASAICTANHKYWEMPRHYVIIWSSITCSSIRVSAFVSSPFLSLNLKGLVALYCSNPFVTPIHNRPLVGSRSPFSRVLPVGQP
ncbi:hypothetical protein HRR83_009190 [Exophiala dermatitidis]|nr:hypothetical protein HRR76_004068 [Exophiala dermatitidis]KAJ4561815.1 hypothetical protein HRR81_009244 [Exophiala dermatitidis]KAJ4586901.1 hypothetical protein HRR83_009190 [Exophiala dermatitidis]KAJ4624573.1 hypothetical protein HRR88_005169 [Exophiala dermatitidis]KAJ4639770.1 hypothetical protein HRR91_008579 [Exophiala dermatitidis]